MPLPLACYLELKTFDRRHLKCACRAGRASDAMSLSRLLLTTLQEPLVCGACDGWYSEGVV